MMRPGGIELTSVGLDDLHEVRAIIARAIEAWPTSERLKRNALSVLVYDAVDLADTRILMAKSQGNGVAVAAWRDQGWMTDPAGRFSALLHGLYVDQNWQRHAIGQLLQRAVADEVLSAGGHGLYVRAERFAVPYFARCGYRRLGSGELVGVTGAYPYRFWISCEALLARPQSAAS